MNKVMRVVALIGVVLSMSMVGCGPTAKPAEPMTISVLYNEKASTPLNEAWLIFEEYAKRRNVTLDVQVGDDSDFAKVIIQTLESGNIPDVVLKVWPNTIDNYAAAGVLLPFSDYENLMPNFKAYIKAHGLEGELDKLRLNNGKYYILPGYQREIQVQQWIYRQDAFEANGLEAPKTYDELFDSLVILKGITPDATPITASWGGAHLFAMMGAGYGIPAGWSGARSYSYEEDRWQYAPATEAYRELYRFLNRCYSAGLLDPEIFIQGDEDYLNKLQDGRALVTVTWITSGLDSWNEKLRENGVADGAWVPLHVPVSTIGIRALPAVDRFRKGLVVPSRVINEPYFEELLRFLDWAIYSEEGMTLTTWGVEGVTFETTPAGKVFLPGIKTPKNSEGTLEITAEYGLDTLFNLSENEEFEDYKKPPEIVAFLADSLAAKDTAPMAPQLSLDSDAIEAARIIDEQITPYVAETSVKFITGELSIDADWAGYMAELDKRGYNTLEAIWNAAWDQQSE